MKYANIHTDGTQIKHNNISFWVLTAANKSMLVFWVVMIYGLLG
jgi:hypothetical protein